MKTAVGPVKIGLMINTSKLGQMIPHVSEIDELILNDFLEMGENKSKT